MCCFKLMKHFKQYYSQCIHISMYWVYSLFHFRSHVQWCACILCVWWISLSATQAKISNLGSKLTVHEYISWSRYINNALLQIPMNETLLMDVVKPLDYFFEDPSAGLYAMISLIDEISECVFWTELHLDMKDIDQTLWFILNSSSQALHRFTTQFRWMKAIIVVSDSERFRFSENYWFLCFSAAHELDKLPQVAVINVCVVWR